MLFLWGLEFDMYNDTFFWLLKEKEKGNLRKKNDAFVVKYNAYGSHDDMRSIDFSFEDRFP